MSSLVAIAPRPAVLDGFFRAFVCGLRAIDGEMPKPGAEAACVSR